MTAADTDDPQQRRPSVRPEIQALRAVAVLLVVVAHLWPSALPGGFVGVDVFFAISGFLITSLLLREIDRTGRLSLSAFWARRARRILPAALVTLLFCAIATIVFVPLTYWQQFLAELRASTAYVQNWQLADSAVDYFAADDGPSPVQHFWSLSAEEQFYVVWPIVLLLAVGLTRARSVRVRRNAIVGAIGTLTAVSLAYSLYDTAANPSAAYFITPTRAWEFGLGGLLALLPVVERSPARLRAALSWGGLAAIAAAAVFYTEKTPFPGYAALLPVLGALAVISAGAPTRRWAPTRGMELPPVRYLGDVSYSVYLWHWPLLIFAPFVIDRALHPEAGFVILALTILAAALSKLLVEDPVRLGSFFTMRGGRWTFAAAAAGTGVVLVVAGGALSHMRVEVAAAERASQKILAAKPKCFGAAARDPRHPCSNPRLRYQVVPTPIAARKAPNHPCKVIERHDDIQVCEFGAPKEGAKATMAVIGDSHASHWRPSLDFVARKKGWHAYNVTHTSCPFSQGVRDIPEPTRSGCQRWKGDVLKWFSQHPEVSHVFAAQLSGGAGIRTSRSDKYAAEVEGYLKAWKTLPRTVKRITVIRDTPKMRGDTDTCVQQAMSAHRRAGPACAQPRSAALDRDPAVTAAHKRTDRVGYVDLTRYLCDSRQCFPVIGGALVYKDATHITSIYGRTLGPYLLRALG
jgi:peptidoglycan/LPS O-acetylase OafA/YrhL